MITSPIRPSRKYEALWTQFNYRGELCLRIVSQEPIPPLVSTHTGPLNVRQRIGASIAFPVNIWEAQLPENVRNIRIDNLEVMLPSSFKKIAFIGDTGCRPAQEDTPDKWPFQAIAERIAAEKPDLIIHLGDMIYRHFTAQQKDAFHHFHPGEGDNWPGWQKEFFLPLANVLPIVPWIFIRGNQENADCACEGWRRFLDGYPYTPQCTAYSPPYAIKLEDVNLVVHDSSYIHPENEQVWPSHQLSTLELTPQNPSWLLTHRPLWGVVNNQQHNEGKPLIMLNEHGNLQAFLQPFPESLTTIFSGHIHAFQFIKLVAYDIHQFVIGNGGVALEEDPPPEVLKNTQLEDRKIKLALSLIQFGYGLAEHTSAGWELTLKDQKGQMIERIPCSPLR